MCGSGFRKRGLANGVSPFSFFLDGGNSALVIGFWSRPILRPPKHCI